MYNYRRMSPAEQEALVAQRQKLGRPWHGPAHLVMPTSYRIVTAACFEHQHLLNTPDRLGWFENELLGAIKELNCPCAAWCVLPNHCHLLVQIDDIKKFAKGLGQLHGRTSFELNKQDNERGRKVWRRCTDRVMRSERHYFTSLNYIHNNPVKHEHAEKWQQWPFSSVHWYWEHKGRDWLLEVWHEHPLLNYGDKWDLF